MQPLTEFLELIISTVEQNCDLGLEISYEEIPTEGGLYVEFGEESICKTYYDKTTEKEIPVIFMSRHSNYKNGLEQLCSICNYLQRLKEYPQGETFTWLDTSIAKEPRKISREEDGQFNFACTLICKIHY